MNEVKLQLPKNLMIIAAVVIIAITFGGYALFFSSQKRVVQKEKEFEMLKEKQIHIEENYNELQKKFDGTSAELKQVNKNYEAILQKHQECQEKAEGLQAKYDSMSQGNDAVRKQLLECQSKAGMKTDPVTPVVPGVTPDHPVQSLSKDKASDGYPADSTTVPASSTPTTPATPAAPVAPGAEGAKPDASSSSIAPQGANEPATKVAGYQCPAPDMVTKHVNQGNWLQDKITWWVDYTGRPIADNEQVQTLFQIFYDGQTVACYYQLTGDTANNVWMVVKGSNKDHAIDVAQNDGWAACTGQECKFFCEKQSLDRCHFTLKK